MLQGLENAHPSLASKARPTSTVAVGLWQGGHIPQMKNAYRERTWVKIRWAATTNALVTGHDRGGESVEREREQELLDCRHEAHHPVGDRLRAVTLLPYGWPREYA